MKCIPMKCIKLVTGIIVRTTDKQAQSSVDSGEAKYCSKGSWKKAGRKYWSVKGELK